MDSLAIIQAQFAIKGLSWESPRVKAWMAAVSTKLDRPICNRFDLPESALIALANKLQSEPYHRPLPVQQLEPITSDKGCIGAGTCEYRVSGSDGFTRVQIDFYGLDSAQLCDWLGLSLQMLADIQGTVSVNGKNQNQKLAA